MDNPYRIELFGQLRFVFGDRSVTDFRYQRVGALLAYLVLSPRYHAREDLVDLFWPDDERTRGLQNLRRTLCDLRATLKAVGIEDPNSVLSTDRVGIQLNPEGITTDVSEFEHYLHQATRATAAGPRADLFKRAISLYQGDLLAECYDVWAADARRFRKHQFVNALTDSGRALEDIGELDQALQQAKKAEQFDPTNEEAFVLQIRLYARLGLTPEAEKTYERLKERLEAETGSDPSDTTKRMVASIRRDPDSFLRPRVMATRPGNLPGLFTRLVGRCQEVEEYKRCLRSARLLTLTGPGGIGKTCLALQTARESLENFHDGAWFVDVCDLRDLSQVVQAIAATVRVREEPGHPLMETLTDYLSSRSLLLILDNCEHLSKACANLAHVLIHGCPYLRILATSRHALGIVRGAITRIVPPLTLPEPETRIGETSQTELLMRYEAIELFVLRASAASADFRLTIGNAPAVMQICSCLGGMPLALELAAAQSTIFAAHEILDALEDMFGLLKVEDPTLPERHQRLFDTIDWSYRLLSEREQEFLLGLAVFHGDTTYQAIQAVCGWNGQNDIRNLLTSMDAKSLVQVIADSSDGHRFRLLNPIREFILRKITSKSLYEALRTHHLAYYLTLAENLQRDSGALTHEQVFDALQQEWPNLQAALDRSIARNDCISGLRLIGALTNFFYYRAYNHQASDWLQALLRSDQTVPLPLYMKGISTAGNLAFQRGELCLAKAHYERWLACEEKNTIGSVSAAASLANVEMLAGNLPKAQEYLERGLETARTLNRVPLIGRILGNLAIVATKSQDYTLALQYHHESISLFRHLEDPVNLATALSNMAHVCISLERFTEASCALQESLNLCRSNSHCLQHSLFLHIVLAVKLERLPLAGALRGALDAYRGKTGLPLHPDAVAEDQSLRTILFADPEATLWEARGKSWNLEELLANARGAYIETDCRE